MFWSWFSFFGALWLMLFNLSLIGSGVPSGSVTLPIHCDYPCQPAPPLPPPSGRPLYGAPPPPPPPTETLYECPPPPPPPTGPVYETPPPPPPPTPTEPVYEAPPAPLGPSCGPPPPPPSPLYAGPPPPALVQGNCQPPMQNCVYPAPNTEVYQPLGSASHLAIYCTLMLIVLSFLFLLPL